MVATLLLAPSRNYKKGFAKSSFQSLEGPKQKENMEIIITSIIWLTLLLSHKYYKDTVIKKQRGQIRMLEEAWTRKKHELQ